MPQKQVIKLKKADLDKALIRGLGRSAWEKKKTRIVSEQVHRNSKKKAARYKKRSDSLEEEF